MKPTQDQIEEQALSMCRQGGNGPVVQDQFHSGVQIGFKSGANWMAAMILKDEQTAVKAKETGKAGILTCEEAALLYLGPNPCQREMHLFLMGWHFICANNNDGKYPGLHGDGTMADMRAICEQRYDAMMFERGQAHNFRAELQDAEATIKTQRGVISELLAGLTQANDKLIRISKEFKPCQ